MGRKEGGWRFLTGLGLPRDSREALEERTETGELELPDSMERKDCLSRMREILLSICSWMAGKTAGTLEPISVRAAVDSGEKSTETKKGTMSSRKGVRARPSARASMLTHTMAGSELPRFSLRAVLTVAMAGVR